MNEPRQKNELILLQQTSLALSAEYANFLGQVLLTISNSNGNCERFYSLLEANLEKLEEGIQTRGGVSLSRILRRLAVARLQEIELESAQSMQESIRLLGDWIQQFPLGDKAGKLEIAITCYEVTDGRRQEVMQQGVDIYANLVQSCINQGKLNLAIEYAERSKTRNLVDLLATRDLYPKGDVPAEILNQLQKLRREIVLEQWLYLCWQFQCGMQLVACERSSNSFFDDRVLSEPVVK